MCHMNHMKRSASETAEGGQWRMRIRVDSQPTWFPIVRRLYIQLVHATLFYHPSHHPPTHHDCFSRFNAATTWSVPSFLVRGAANHPLSARI